MKELTVLVLLAGNLLASAGEVSDYFYQRVPANTTGAPKATSAQNPRSQERAVSTNQGITEIGIERAGSVWGGPVYTFIARSDGTFSYQGKKGVQHTGGFSGKIPIRQFHELADFIADSGYASFADDCSDPWITDQETTYTTVVVQGKRKVIRHYGRSGPKKLWGIEQRIDDLMGMAEWKMPVLPKLTQYDAHPVARAAYLASYEQGYSDAWGRDENLPVFAPTNEVDKAKVFGYVEGMVAGRTALRQWFGTNSSQMHLTNVRPAKP